VACLPACCVVAAIIQFRSLSKGLPAIIIIINATYEVTQFN